MSGGQRWYNALLIASVLAVGLLVVQYILGLWSNVYAPSAFTSNTSFPALDAHYDVGYLLGVVALLVVVFAALTREARLIGTSVVVLISVGLAGVFGMMFVRTTPNDPLDSIGMGIMFLVALGAAMNLAYYLRSRPGPAVGGSPTAPPAVPSS